MHSPLNVLHGNETRYAFGMILLAVTVLVASVILLGSFIGKMMFYVACIFVIYVVGLFVVSGLYRLGIKASRFHQRHHPGGFIVAL